MFSDFTLEPLVMPDTELSLIESTFTKHYLALPPLPLPRLTSGHVDINESDDEITKFKSMHCNYETVRSYHAKCTMEMWTLLQITESNWISQRYIKTLFYTALYDQRRIEICIASHQVRTQQVAVCLDDIDLLQFACVSIHRNLNSIFQSFDIPAVVKLTTPCIAAELLQKMLFIAGNIVCGTRKTLPCGMTITMAATKLSMITTAVSKVLVVA